jgi:mono/diheme cytochrome c family protein
VRPLLVVALWLAPQVVAAATPQRAVPGAGWSAVPVSGNGGEQTFHRYCWECHGDGPDRPGTMALAAKYKGAIPALLDQRSDLTIDFVTTTVRHGISVMPSMRKTEIGDAELQAIATYLAHGKK